MRHLRHLIHLLLAPLALLLVGAFDYALTGYNMLPSEDGGRWIVLTGLAFLFTAAWFALMDSEL